MANKKKKIMSWVTIALGQLKLKLENHVLIEIWALS